MITEKVKEIARSMVTASHANQLPDEEFENYLMSIRAEILKEVAEYLEEQHRESYAPPVIQSYKSWWDKNWQFLARLKAGLLP